MLPVERVTGPVGAPAHTSTPPLSATFPAAESPLFRQDSQVQQLPDLKSHNCSLDYIELLTDWCTL